MSRKEAMLKNTLILTIGKASTQLITFFLLPLYTAILSTEEYGIVDLMNTLVSLLLPIVTFQVEQALFRYLIEVRNDDENKTCIISTGIISVVIQCIIYLCIFSILFPFIHNEYKGFLATNVVAYIFASLFQQITRGLGDNKKYAMATFITASSTILFNLLFLLVIKLGANGMLLANMLAQIVCVIYLILSLRLYQYINYHSFRKEILLNLWKYSLPLIPNAISWWIFNASDRVIISTILGVAQNGILSAAHKFSGIYITFYNIFNMSWTEMIVMHINDDDIEEFFNKMFNVILKFFVSVSIGIISIMPFIFPILINIKFEKAYNQIPIMMIGSIFNVVVGLISVIYVANKNTKAIANTSIVSAIINFIINLCLIKFIGLYAASISTLIAFLIMSIYRIYDIRKKYFKIKFEKAFLFKTIITLVFTMIAYYSKNYGFYIVSLLIAIFYGWNTNKDSIGEIFKIIKKKLKK